MRLKKLRKTTEIRIKNEGEYLLLMELVEKAGYIWSGTLNKPTRFNNVEEYRHQTKVIELLPAVGTMTRTTMQTSQKEAVPLKKVIKFEVGDKVRLREGIIKKLRKEKSLPTETLISEMKKHVNKEDIIEDSFPLILKNIIILKDIRASLSLKNGLTQYFLPFRKKKLLPKRRNKHENYFV